MAAKILNKISKQSSSSIKEVFILWITAGLGCDGESVSITAATQPSIEDIVMGGLPGVPQVRFLNPFYSYENADEYIAYLELAEKGKLNLLFSSSKVQFRMRTLKTKVIGRV